MQIPALPIGAIGFCFLALWNPSVDAMYMACCRVAQITLHVEGPPCGGKGLGADGADGVVGADGADGADDAYSADGSDGARDNSDDGLPQ